MVRRKRVHLAVGISGGLIVLVAGCAATSDAVVVMAPKSPQTVTQQVAAARDGDSPATPAAPVVTAPPTSPPTTAPPAPTTTTIPTAQPLIPIPAIAPLAPSRVGQNSPQVAALEQRLLQLGFWLDAADGHYTSVTAQAVMAYQKDQGLKRTGNADQATVGRLSQAQNHVISHAVVGNLIEVDKSKQLLYVVRNGQVMWAINTSTGSGQRYSATSKITGKDASGVAVTPNGMHTVYRQQPNGWHSGDLGSIYRPKYFAGGAAIHGFNRIPAYPASHGCVRVSTAFMDYVWAANLVPLKSTVWVHDVADATQPIPAAVPG